MNKRFTKAVALSTALLIGTSFVTVNAANIKKEVTAAYYNIKVTLNGQYKTPTNEPFMIGDSVYVGLRDFSEITGNEVKWDGASKTVHITSQNSGATNAELIEKNLQIAQLESKVRSLEEKLKQYEGTGSGSGSNGSSNVNSTAIKKVLSYLDDEYGDKYSIDWSFDLASNSKDKSLELEISFDSYYDEKDFDRMSTSKLEGFIEDICDYIQDELGDLVIKGELVDEDEDEALRAFEMSTSGKLKVRTVNSTQSLRRFEDYMIDEYTKLPNIASGTLDGKEIKVSDVALYEDDDFEEITFELSTDLSSTYADAWDALTSSDVRGLRTWLEDIESELKKEFGSDYVFGYIYNKYDKIVASYEYGKLSLNAFKEK